MTHVLSQSHFDLAAEMEGGKGEFLENLGALFRHPKLINVFITQRLQESFERYPGIERLFRYFEHENIQFIYEGKDTISVDNPRDLVILADQVD